MMKQYISENVIDFKLEIIMTLLQKSSYSESSIQAAVCFIIINLYK